MSHRISVGGLPSADCVASSLVTPGNVFALGLQYDQLLTDSLHLVNSSVSRPADPRSLVGNTQASQGCGAAWCHRIETHCNDEQGVAGTFRNILNLRWLGWQSTVVTTMNDCHQGHQGQWAQGAAMSKAQLVYGCLWSQGEPETEPIPSSCIWRQADSPHCRHKHLAHCRKIHGVPIACQAWL